VTWHALGESFPVQAKCCGHFLYSCIFETTCLERIQVLHSHVIHSKCHSKSLLNIVVVLWLLEKTHFLPFDKVFFIKLSELMEVVQCRLNL